MHYDYQKIKKEVEKLVKDACDKTVVRDRIWEFHIIPVVKFSKQLGRELGADLEILELSALLHDYASILDRDFDKNHHIESAKKAQEILTELNFPRNKVNHIVDCIEAHRGSIKQEHKTLESEILASADAMSHISEPVSMLHLAFRVLDNKVIEGSSWLRGKIQRSWEKTIPEGQEMIRNDYERIVKMLDDVIEKE
ncbi:MAG: HD domain-containing protein [Patescibacteria group bacterium]|jgi:HD superfamily phosphodiesterase|nr:HD domain-containing protein [Patescibacteria group bacterium]